MSSQGSAAMLPTSFSTGVRIQPPGYEAVLWCSVALPLPFVLFRLYVRAHVFRQLFLDDALVVLAWLLQVAYCATQQVYLPDVYYVVDLGLGMQPDATLSEHFDRFQIASVAGNILPCIGLWSIKFSFLVFFRRLGSGVRHQTVLWWVVACFNTACFVVWLAVIAWPCLMHPFMEVIVQCSSPAAQEYSLRVPQIQTAVDIVSDCAILLIPFTLVWKVRLRWQQKVSLASIFSLTLFIMAASIVRTEGAVLGSEAVNEIWLYGWMAVELGVAIVVACLASFRALFTAQGASQANSYGAVSRADSIERRGLARLRGRLFHHTPPSMDKEIGSSDCDSPPLGPQHAVRTHVTANGLPVRPMDGMAERYELGVPNYPDQVYVQTNWKQSSRPVQ